MREFLIHLVEFKLAVRGESKVKVSPLYGCRKPAVAMFDPGDSHSVGLIRLLTDSNTTAGGGSVVTVQKPTRQSRVNPCYLSQDAFHLVDSIHQNNYNKFITGLPIRHEIPRKAYRQFKYSQ